MPFEKEKKKETFLRFKFTRNINIRPFYIAIHGNSLTKIVESKKLSTKCIADFEVLILFFVCFDISKNAIRNIIVEYVLILFLKS